LSASYHFEYGRKSSKSANVRTPFRARAYGRHSHTAVCEDGSSLTSPATFDQDRSQLRVEPPEQFDLIATHRAHPKSEAVVSGQEPVLVRDMGQCLDAGRAELAADGCRAGSIAVPPSILVSALAAALAARTRSSIIAKVPLT
jgi:hypothetical protein